MKLTCERAKYFLKDEEKASREYNQLGFKKLARDESTHAKFFRKKIKELCK